MREKINHQFINCVIIEKKLQLENENTVVIERLMKHLELGKKRQKKLRMRLARKNISPSNAQIAKLLGITKGTVDSAMYSLKKRLRGSD
jgi:predicted PhzF superfamily epimerase YddE/YHI9